MNKIDYSMLFYFNRVFKCRCFTTKIGGFSEGIFRFRWHGNYG